MNSSSNPLKYFLLYLPWLAATLCAANPVNAYLIAWVGSFFIFYLSFTNKIKDTSSDLPLSQKILKPLYLTQIIFAGYMCCTSIFYFLDNMGYIYATKNMFRSMNLEQIKHIAICQRYYVLGHAAFAHGLLLFYKSDSKTNHDVVDVNWPVLFTKIAVICLPLSFLFGRIGALSQFKEQMEGLSLVAATLALAISIPQKKLSITVITGLLYALNLSKALVSGFKEPVIVSVLILGIFLYPYYKKTVVLLFIPLMFLLFMVLPTYVNTMRQLARQGGSDAAQKEALAKVQSDLSSADIEKTNWEFLTERLSEISMFVQYKKSIEARKDDYGLKITKQALLSIIPRFIWPGKPNTEEMVMERVYENHIIDRGVENSAKPAVIVDGFLSGGALGVWITLFLYGAFAQGINNKAEELFGGYFLGSAFVFTGLFRIFWRGNCFEFLFNNIFWSFITMYILFYLFKKIGVLYPKVEAEESEPLPGAQLLNQQVN
ncbi:MAG: exosortase Y-associated Wzy-like protein [Ilyomonas sp.]